MFQRKVQSPSPGWKATHSILCIQAKTKHGPLGCLVVAC